MPKNHYDYIIVGNGLAGLQLALAFSNNSYFIDKQIALIDSSNKNENDKTWSFWETEPSKWSNIIHKSWDKANIYSNTKHVHLDLSPYQYKSIRAIDFYKEAKSKLEKKSNITFVIDEVDTVVENDNVEVNSKENSYIAKHVFDSRIPEDYFINSKNYETITQHFKGWVIKTDSDKFNPNECTIMDYRLKDGEKTTFMYVLPFSSSEALIEFTYFTEHIVPESTYDEFIKQYLTDFLDIKTYTIIETETGKIPMTSYPFNKNNTKKVTKIGTAGGWVKGSTGYSFKITERKVKQIISNIKNDKVPSDNLFKWKYKFYDRIFLKVLKDENHKGEWIFQEFYRKNSVKTMFRFLDEESTIFEELRIMLSLVSWSFIKALFKTL